MQRNGRRHRCLNMPFRTSAASRGPDHRRVDYRVIGGVATQAYGAERPTGDFDRLDRRSVANFDRPAAAMRALLGGRGPRRRRDTLPVAPAARPDPQPVTDLDVGDRCLPGRVGRHGQPPRPPTRYEDLEGASNGGHDRASRRRRWRTGELRYPGRFVGRGCPLNRRFGQDPLALLAIQSSPWQARWR